MPIYTYYCSECEGDREITCKIDERNLQRCPTCSNVMDKKIDKPGLVWAPTRKSGL